mgnify:CR=1 FL=1
MKPAKQCKLFDVESRHFHFLGRNSLWVVLEPAVPAIAEHLVVEQWVGEGDGATAKQSDNLASCQV